ncbi:MAG: hypothetical protein ACTHL1_09220 [Burkholderiaceae bacterium]
MRARLSPLFRIPPFPARTACVLQAALLAAMIAPLAHAQTEVDRAPPPPRLEPLPEGEPPAVTIQSPDGNGSKQDRSGTILEKRERGRVTEIKVDKGNSTYYLKPNVQPGSSLPGDAESMRNRAPQWRIGGFDLHRPKDEQKPGASPASPAPVPPPPPLSK